MAGDAGTEEAAGPVVTRVMQDQILHMTKRKHDMFVANHGMRPQDVEAARKVRLSVKTRDEYWAVKDLPPPPGAAAAAKPEDGVDAAAKAHLKQTAVRTVHEQEAENAAGGEGEQGGAGGPAGQLALYKPQGSGSSGSTALMVRAGKSLNMPKPEWHAPWKLMRVISGHLGWVRCICVEPGNEWFATGAGDRTVKIWDLASGELKITLTGHIRCARAARLRAAPAPRECMIACRGDTCNVLDGRMFSFGAPSRAPFVLRAQRGSCGGSPA